MKREQIRVTPELRVESGPKRVVALATKELLDDRRTAPHYYEGGKDALGKTIVLGEPMTYLDYYGEETWYLYQLEDVELSADMLRNIVTELMKQRSKWMEMSELTAKDIAKWFGVSEVWVTPDPWRMKRFMPRGEKPTKDEAIAAVKALED